MRRSTLKGTPQVENEDRNSLEVLFMLLPPRHGTNMSRLLLFCLSHLFLSKLADQKETYVECT